ncbi:MAG TPA: hypothetical protein PLK12_11845 [Prolixibacteraceae bacterium]|nr:hypothetical protein [Prolixibacteraceae bacterium]
MEKKSAFSSAFHLFQNVESCFDDRDRTQSGKMIFIQLLILCLFAFLYGVVMGSYHSFLQSLVAGLKVMFLFLCSLLICFPSFFVIQQVLGSKMTIRQMIFVVLSGFVLTAAIALSFSPIIILFQITGGNYHFLQLLHVAIFLFSGIFGMRRMVEALKFACENKDIYPRIGVTVFRIWIIILAFVGIQLSWNLRPFLCNKQEEFKLFRKYEGNFYTAIVYSVQQLAASKENHPVAVSDLPDTRQKNIQAETNDSTVLRLLNE